MSQDTHVHAHTSRRRNITGLFILGVMVAMIIIAIWLVQSGQIQFGNSGNNFSEEDFNAAVSPLQTQIAGIAVQATEPAARDEPTATARPTERIEEETVESAQVDDETPEPTATRTSGTRCQAGDSYNIDGLDELDSTEVFLHVQYWVADDDNELEFETILEPGHTWSVDLKGGGGMVWEYPATCEFSDVRQQATLSINRRGEKSGGYIAWDMTEVFSQN